MPDVRPARADDFGALGRIFYEAVRIGAATHYTDAQRAAWAPQQPDATGFAERLSDQIVLVAADPQPVGFFSLRRDGYLDMCFVAPDRIGQGIARLLMTAIEEEARKLGLEQLTTHASDMAKPAFTHLGWGVIRPNTVEKHAVALRNWVMMKGLNPEGSPPP